MKHLEKLQENNACCLQCSCVYIYRDSILEHDAFQTCPPEVRTPRNPGAPPFPRPCPVVATYGVRIHTRGVAHSGCFKRKDVGPTDQPKTKGYFKLRVVLHGGITANRSKPLGLCGTLLADKLNFCLANA